MRKMSTSRQRASDRRGLLGAEVEGLCFNTTRRRGERSGDPKGSPDLSHAKIGQPPSSTRKLYMPVVFLYTHLIKTKGIDGYLSSSSLPQEVITLQLGTVSSQAVVEWGGLHRLPEALQSLGISGRIFIVTDAD